MQNFKITVQYDGTNYKGWQVQSSTKDTIQGKLQDILGRLEAQNVKGPDAENLSAGGPDDEVTKVEVIGSGRTDAGVHAMEQVANFHMDLPEGMDMPKLLVYINTYLPEDIAVTSIEEVDDKFHARFNAKAKTYRYRIHTSPVSNVFEKRFVYSIPCSLDVERMRHGARYLIGTHDFMAFCGNKHMKKSTVRTVNSIEITSGKNLKEIQIDYTGDGFLQNMVRIMTGTLIEIGQGRMEPEDIPAILESRNRENAGYTAPPQGLCLMHVEY